MPHSTPHFPVTLLVTLSKGHHLPLHIYQNCSYKSHAVNEMSIKLANHLSLKTVEVTQHLSMHVNIRNIHPGSKTSSALTIWCVFSFCAGVSTVSANKKNASWCNELSAWLQTYCHLSLPSHPYVNLLTVFGDLQCNQWWQWLKEGCRKLMLESLIMKAYASHSRGNCNSLHQRTRHWAPHPESKAEGRGH